MVVSNPNDGSKKVENKKSSLFGSLLGFFYNHTKGILTFVLAFIIVASFTAIFIDKLETSKMSLIMNPPVFVIFSGMVKSVYRVISLFVPILFVCVLLKWIMIKRKGLKIEYMFNKAFKLELLFSFLISFMFAVLFFADIFVLTKYSPQLLKTSWDIFLMTFVSIFMTLTSLYSVVKGIDFVVVKKRK